MSTRRSQERAREFRTGCKIADLSPEQLGQARAAGLEPDGQWLIGRDPRTMAQDELKAMGHEPMSPMEAIRLKCLDCCAGSAHEVRCCAAVVCPSWPFRLGRNPWRAPLSEARRAALRERGFASSKPHEIARPPSLVGSQTGEAPAASER